MIGSVAQHQEKEDRMNPLLSIVVARVESNSSGVFQEDLDRAIKAVTDQVYRAIDFTSCSTVLRSTIGNDEPAIYVRDVLSALANHKISAANSDEDNSKEAGKKCRMWTRDEDILLMAGISRFGLGDWKDISKFVGGGRTRSQCSQRWGRALNPKIVKDRWDSQEELRLVDLVHQHGEHSWAIVAKLLGTRSDVQCRYRYYQIFRERKPSPVVACSPRSSQSPSSPASPIGASGVTDISSIPAFGLAFGKELFNCSIDQMMPPLLPRNGMKL